MKKSFPGFLFLQLLLISLFLCACPRQKEIQSAEIKTYTSGSLQIPGNKNAPDTIYVAAPDGAPLPPLFTSELQNMLKKSRFSLTESPSKAGYILHISFLDSGEVDPAGFSALVSSGYGTKAKFSGHGATAVLADALLVQRRVPTAKRPSHARLENITTRNALGSNQMRLGLMLISGSQTDSDNFFANALAHALGEALVSSPQADATQ